jgi:AcrR family transcriptional regulator
MAHPAPNPGSSNHRNAADAGRQVLIFLLGNVMATRMSPQRLLGGASQRTFAHVTAFTISDLSAHAVAATAPLVPDTPRWYRAVRMTTTGPSRLADAPPDLSAGRDFGPRHLELLNGLEAVILTDGFRDLTIGGLAEQLQCSRRTLYEIAESKEAIVLLAIDRIMHRLAYRAHDAVLAEHSHYDKLCAFLTKGLIELRMATVAFAEDVADAPAVHELIVHHLRYAQGLAATMLAEGTKAGEFIDVDPAVAAEMLDAGLERLLDPEALRRAGVGLGQGFEIFLKLFTYGLRPVTPTALAP